MPREDYTAFVEEEEDGLRPFSQGAIIGSSMDGGPSVGTIYTTGECTECGDAFVLIGEDFRHVSSKEREMGEERQYVSVPHAYCENCEHDLMLEIEFWEYPKGSIEAYGIRPEHNAAYLDVKNIEYLA